MRMGQCLALDKDVEGKDATPEILHVGATEVLGEVLMGLYSERCG